MQRLAYYHWKKTLVFIIISTGDAGHLRFIDVVLYNEIPLK